MSKTKNDFFDDENSIAPSWWKPEVIGDSVMGEVIDIFEKEATGDYAAQKVFVLQTDDGVINVPISYKKGFLIRATSRVKIGDQLGFKFVDEIPSKKYKEKDGTPKVAKSIRPYWKPSGGVGVIAAAPDENEE